MTTVGSPEIELLLNAILLLLMVVAAIGVIRLRNLFAVVLLSGVYSFLMATLMVALDAVDVGMTEAAVGAGMSVVLLLSVLGLTRTREAPTRRRPIVPLIISVVVGIALVHGTMDLPPFGDPNAPAQRHVAPEYLARAQVETGAPNVVTAVLAAAQRGAAGGVVRNLVVTDPSETGHRILARRSQTRRTSSTSWCL